MSSSPRSLLRVLTSQLLLVALVPLLLVGLAVTLLIWPRIEADMAEHSRRLAEAIRGQVGLFLAAPEQTLYTLSDVLMATRLDAAHTSALLDANVGSGEVFDAIYVVAPDGTVEGVGLPLRQRALRDNFLGLDVSRRAFIATARREDRPAWSDTFLSILGGGISLGLAVPIGDRLLVGDFNLDHLSYFMASLGDADTLLPMVIDGKGHIIAHPDISLGRQQLNVANLPLVRRALNGETGIGRFEFEGQVYTGTTALVSGRRWIALVAENERIARRGFDATVYALLAAALAATFAAALLAVFAARRLARPFHDFSTQARALSTGRFDLRFEPSEVAEIKAMAQTFTDMADKLREREQRLSASQGQYRQVVEGTDDLITRVDDQGRFTFVNGAGARVFGLPPAQLVGRSAFEFVHPDDRATTQGAFEGWLESGEERFGYENRQVGVDGRVRDMLWTVSADRDERGRVTALTGIARDISARKRDEDALREQQAIIEHAAAEEQVLLTFSRLSLQSLSLEEFLDGVLRQLVADVVWMPLEPPAAILLFEQSDAPRIAAAVGLAESTLADLAAEFSATPEPPGMHSVDIATGERVLGRLLLSLAPGDGLDVRALAFLARVTDILGLGIMRRQAEHETAYLALHDALTGLANRRLVLDRIEHELSAARRGNRYGALLCLDLDHFKTLNDSLGHAAGDLLLREVAERLRLRARAEDTVARLGGDEFLVLLPSLSADRGRAGYHARTIADDMRARLGAPIDLGGHHHHVTASIGIVVFPDGADEPGDLLRMADVALYSAKADGRDTVSFFEHSMQVTADARLRLNKEVRSAIEHEQFEVYYQPRVDGDGNIRGAEALLRWHHPQRGLVMPGEFIPIAEESGMIVPLGEWVLSRACHQLAEWEAEDGPRLPKLSINVSPWQFRQRDFPALVARTLAASGVDSRRIALEVTESALMGQFEGALSKMRDLKALGVQIAVDDFGTGYSSLAYLRSYPIDELKIDRSFVGDILTDSNDAAIVGTVLAMGSRLSLNCVAEGVETRAQLESLLAMGCREFQGFLFSPPVPAAEFVALWKRGRTGGGGLPVPDDREG